MLYRNTPESAEAAGGVGIAFEAEDLRVRERYSWDVVTEAYETWLRGLVE